MGSLTRLGLVGTTVPNQTSERLLSERPPKKNGSTATLWTRCFCVFVWSNTCSSHSTTFPPHATQFPSSGISSALSPEFVQRFQKLPSPTEDATDAAAEEAAAPQEALPVRGSSTGRKVSAWSKDNMWSTCRRTHTARTTWRSKHGAQDTGAWGGGARAGRSGWLDAHVCVFGLWKGDLHAVLLTWGCFSQA